MRTITRRGEQELSAAEFVRLRARHTSTLVDLGCGDGAWPRRFAREYPQCLAVGVDSDRDALRQAAKLAERKPARGGAPNALFVAAQAESLPPELHGAADWVTIYFPWSALLRMILSGDAALAAMLDQLCAERARLSAVLNAEAAPEGFERPTPKSVRQALAPPLESIGFRVVRSDRVNTDDAPPTTWSGRLIKGSGRAMVGLEAVR